MADNAPAAESRFAAARRAMFRPKTLVITGLSCVLLGLGCLAYWTAELKPQLDLAQKRFESHTAMMRLFDLQKTYLEAHGAYANDLDALLAGAPDADKLRETLKNSVDINTLVIRGDDKRFRIEANILDPDRTLVKFRGPTGGL